MYCNKGAGGYGFVTNCNKLEPRGRRGGGGSEAFVTKYFVVETLCIVYFLTFGGFIDYLRPEFLFSFSISSSIYICYGIYMRWCYMWAPNTTGPSRLGTTITGSTNTTGHLGTRLGTRVACIIADKTGVRHMPTRPTDVAVAIRSGKGTTQCFRQALPRFSTRKKPKTPRFLWAQYRLPNGATAYTWSGAECFNQWRVAWHPALQGLAGSHFAFTRSMRVLSRFVKQDGRQRIGAQKFRCCGDNLWRRSEFDGFERRRYRDPRHRRRRRQTRTIAVGHSRRGRWWICSRFDITVIVFERIIRLPHSMIECQYFIDCLFVFINMI